MEKYHDNDDLFHHVRHGLTGLYYERKKILNSMLCIADALESNWKPNFLKSLYITLAVRRQLKSIRRIDDYLGRMQDALIRRRREK